MKRTCAALVAVTLLSAGAALAPAPAHAAPPTVTPSPGYDARLQEQRAATRAGYEPVAPVAKPVTRRHGKKTHAH